MIEYFSRGLHQEVIFAVEVMGVTAEGVELLLEEQSEGHFSVVLHYADGTEERLPASTPAEALLHAVEIDYSDYRREVRRLREEHPLFEERLDIPVVDLEDFVAEALLLLSMIREKDPVGFFVLGEFLDRSLRMEDDGSASFLLRAGQRILRVLEEPLRVQTYLRNVFEVTFDGVDGATQQEQFERLRATYPDAAQGCDPVLLADVPVGERLFAAHDLFALYLLELALYFSQDSQRIARCEYCWGYFIPKTKKVTRYCDRVIDGFHCKQRGSRFQRNEGREKDQALRIYKQLRDRMYARFLRYQDAAPKERSKLFPMDFERYDAWSENASAALKDYKAGTISAEEFLRRIDTTHELESYEIDQVKLVETEETPWQKLVARSWAFDPERFFPEEMIFLDLGQPDPQWKMLTADELRRRTQKGHQSLREKYGKA